MSWPFSALTTYLANSLPAIKALDLNSIQDAINDLYNNHHHVGTGDNAPKIDQTEWLPTASVSNNGQRWTSVGDAVGISDAVARRQFAFGLSSPAGYLKIPWVLEAGVSIGTLLVQWIAPSAGFSGSLVSAATSTASQNWATTFGTVYAAWATAGLASGAGNDYGVVAVINNVTTTTVAVTVSNSTSASRDYRVAILGIGLAP